MNRAQFIILSDLRLFYWMCKLFGLCPLHYTFQKIAFVWTWRDIFYSILVWLIFAYFYFYTGQRFRGQINPLLTIAVVYFSIFTITVMFLVQCLHANKLTNLLNTTIELWRQVNAICKSLSVRQTIRYGWKFFGKVFLVSSIAELASFAIGSELSDNVTETIDSTAFITISIGYIVQTLVPNMFYVFILTISIQYDQLNNEIRKIVHQATEISTTDCNRRRNDVLIVLSQQLDRIASLHAKITAHANITNRVFSLQLLVIIGNFVAIILIEVSPQVYKFTSFDCTSN